ncbi:metallophosphoesterase [Pseudomonas sp. Pseusp122]|uniref:metallophosphoesterase n=1 Tax=unclassified Pseudomonas TaxID=196821 RepID=UPI0039A49314
MILKLIRLKVGGWLIAVLVLMSGCAALFNFMFNSPPVYTPLVDADSSQVSMIGIGDQGSGNLKQWQVALAMERVALRDGRLDMVVLLGDNFYGKSLTGVHDWNWQMKFERVYWGHYLSHIPFYAVLGNHDYPVSSDIEIEYSRQHAGSGRWQMPAHSYTKDFGRVDGRPLLRMVFLDTSAPLNELKTQIEGLEKAFDQGEPEPVWRVVAAHHPVRNAGGHGEESRLVEQLLPALQRSRVDLYLSGHDHNQQLLLREGEPAWLISGGGGQTIAPLPVNGVTTTFTASRTGFVKLDFSRTRMQLSFYDDSSRPEMRYFWDRDCPWLARSCVKAGDPDSRK